MLPLPIYTPGWRETKWSKGSCPWNQCNRQGFNLDLQIQSFSCEQLAHLCLHFLIALSHYLTLKSDQREISCYYVNALENREVMRIEYMIREDVYTVIDESTNSPHYFCWKSIGTVYENPNFDIRVKRDKESERKWRGHFFGKGPCLVF